MCLLAVESLKVRRALRHSYAKYEQRTIAAAARISSDGNTMIGLEPASLNLNHRKVFE